MLNPSSTITITLNSGAVGAKGRRIDYGAEQQKS
jgi:hypothetical protein